MDASNDDSSISDSRCGGAAGASSCCRREGNSRHLVESVAITSEGNVP